MNDSKKQWKVINLWLQSMGAPKPLISRGQAYYTDKDGSEFGIIISIAISHPGVAATDLWRHGLIKGEEGSPIELIKGIPDLPLTQLLLTNWTKKHQDPENL